MDKIIVYLVLIVLSGCHNSDIQESEWKADLCKKTKGALVGTRFSSLEELERCIAIEYSRKKTAIVKHHSNGQTITSILKDGVTEKDLERVKQGKIMEKLSIVASSPYLIFCREDLQRIMLLARRSGSQFGEGDKTFYDLAQAMVHNIEKTSADSIFQSDYTEKGLLNTFNHLTAQAFITTLFSERTADYVADLHEIDRLPELTTGKFSKEQREDLSNGPVDNYVDLINNEWGQELGKSLKSKHKITRATQWNPKLMQAYLNDIQSYCAWSVGLHFRPFLSTDEIVVKFASKINQVLKESYS